MITVNPIKSNQPAYSFIETLLHDSFPIDERRDDAQQREYTDNNPLFSCYQICTNDKTPIGLITIWSLNGFHYIEHLATSPIVRNKGYGKLIMHHLIEKIHGVIILEVERPTDDLSTRRIGFYQRCGFSLCTKNYIQPPYRKGGNELPLYLMFHGTENIDNQFNDICKEIYTHVYNKQI